jgi:hypothetical protein
VQDEQGKAMNSQQTRWVAAVCALACSVAVAAQDARERRFIRQGMHEGEVLLRVGKPDHEAFIRNVRGQPEEKTWAYFPHPRDPQTLTIFTLRAGVVSTIERKIVR